MSGQSQMLVYAGVCAVVVGVLYMKSQSQAATSAKTLDAHTLDATPGANMNHSSFGDMIHSLVPKSPFDNSQIDRIPPVAVEASPNVHDQLEPPAVVRPKPVVSVPVVSIPISEPSNEQIFGKDPSDDTKPSTFIGRLFEDLPHAVVSDPVVSMPTKAPLPAEITTIPVISDPVVSMPTNPRVITGHASDETKPSSAHSSIFGKKPHSYRNGSDFDRFFPPRFTPK